MSTQLQKTEDEKGTTTYVPFGSDMAIKLSVAIVQNQIAVKTKSGATCSTNHALKFIAMCRAQKLNPYAGDAYLIGYDSKDGPSFSLITAHQAFLKRAEVSPHYDGMLSGVIVFDEKTEKIIEIEGDFYEKDQVVVGGWAKVFHKNRTYPTYRRIRLERFNKGHGQWEVDAAGMIVKCAEADALRSTFPTMLGGLYIEGERQAGNDIEITATVVPDGPALVSDAPPSPPPAGEALPAPKKASATDALADAITKAGFTFDEFKVWMSRTGNLREGTELDDYTQIRSTDVARFNRMIPAIIEAMTKLKGQA